MPSNEFDVRIASSKDEGQYLALMNRGDFRRTKTAAYFRWFYTTSPRKTLLLLARHRGGLVAGQMGLQFRRLSGHPVAVIVDIVVAPEFRGRGAFGCLEGEAARLADAEGACALTSFTNPRGLSALLRLGTWHLAAEIATLQCSTPRPDALGNAGATRPGRFLHFATDDADQDWRFRRHPEHQYREWPALGGALWTKNFTEPGGEVMTDLVTVGGGRPTEPTVLLDALGKLSAEGASRFTAWALRGVPDEPTLRAAGFIEGAQRRTLCVRWLSREIESREHGIPWAVSQSDTEVF